MNLKSIKLVLLLLGTIIGAGFASGKEIATFFTRFGFLSFGLAVLCGFLFYYTCKLFLIIGKEIKPTNFSDISKYLFAKNHKVFDAFLICCFMISIAAMCAGANAIGIVVIKNYDSLYIGLIVAIIGMILSFGGLKVVSNVNYIIVPVIILFIVIGCVLSVFKIEPSFDIIYDNLEMVDYFMAIGSTVIYVCLNMLSSGLILMQIGKNYTSKEIKRASIAFGIVIAFLIIVISLALILSNFGIFNSEMPLLALSLNINDIFAIIMSFNILIAILSSIVSTVYIVAFYLKKIFKSYFISVIITSIISFLISILGFSTIVKYCYPVMGVLGVVMILFLFKKSGNFHIFSKSETKKLMRLK